MRKLDASHEILGRIFREIQAEISLDEEDAGLAGAERSAEDPGSPKKST